MKILISNDDGIFSVGLTVLQRAARKFSDDVWAVVPDDNCSATSRSISIHKPLKVNKVDSHTFSVTGTPSDCLLVALQQVLTSPPDLILSGINLGTNLATDVGYSGTVGIVIEGMIQGITSIAFSQHYEDIHSIDWDMAYKNCVDIIHKLCLINKKQGAAFNVNFPIGTPKGIKIVQHSSMLPCVNIKKIDHDSEYEISGGGTFDMLKRYKKIKEERLDLLPQYEIDKLPYLERTIIRRLHENVKSEIDDNSDLTAISNGYISLTPIKIDFNDYDNMQILKEHFE